MIGAIGSKGCEKLSAALAIHAFDYLAARTKFWHCRWPTLCSELPRGLTSMLEQKAKREEATARSSTTKSQPDSSTGHSVIVLHDLTPGPEAEISRLKTRVIELTVETGNLRNENQSLKAELREIKLVLSKVQLDELRGFEKVNSWLRSLKLDL